MSNELEYSKIPSTGDEKEKAITRWFPFGIYDILIKMNENDQIIAVVGIRINKSFLNFKQKIALSDFFDISKFYPPDDENSE